MTVSIEAWEKYIKTLAAVDKTAAQKFAVYLQRKQLTMGVETVRKEVIDYAYALTKTYGESAAAAACEMYDAVAKLEGMFLQEAVPAETASYGEVAKTVNGMIRQKASAESMGAAVGRLVKRAGIDTTMKNALRDGAQWAWIPSGDTCAFCIMLASRGWQNASKKALRKGHAEHVHSNCDCTYAVRHDSRTEYKGYDPDKYLNMYEEADEDGRSWQSRVNVMRRQQYAEKKDKINQQKREAYAARQERLGEGEKQ